MSAAVAERTDHGRATRLPPGFLDELKNRVPLADVVSRRVRLERAGREMRGCCPFHGERTPSLYIYADGHYHCFGCGAHGDAVEFTMQMEGLGFLDAVRALAGEAGMEIPAGMPEGDGRPREAPPPPPPRAPSPEQIEAEERRRRYALAIFLEAEERLRGTPVAAYLAGRGIDLDRLGRQPRALRFHPALKAEEIGVELPAMVAAITDGDGNHVATHRTWLVERDGRWRKASPPLENAKKTIGRPQGGCIHLWRGASGRRFREAPEGDVVAIGEGIETSLSVAIACPELRVIAAGALGWMAGIALPTAIRTVIICADNDTGKPRTEQQRRQAEAQFQRVVAHFQGEGREVRVAMPDIPGADWNDVLQGVEG